MKPSILLLLLCGFGSPALGGEYYQAFISSVATNRDSYSWLCDYPILVDENNTGAKLTGGTLDLQRLKKHGEVSGVRLGMTMDKVVGRWGKPPRGYAPRGCLHGLTTFMYEDVALAFQGDRVETIEFCPRMRFAGGLSTESKPDDFTRVLGSPTERAVYGTVSCLAYLSPRVGLRLDFHEKGVGNIWLERTPSRAAPLKRDPGANKSD